MKSKTYNGEVRSSEKDFETLQLGAFATPGLLLAQGPVGLTAQSGFNQRHRSVTRCFSGKQPILTKLRNSRSLRCAAVLLAGFLVAGFAYVPILREIASFLIVEDPLRPAAAIVVLGGQSPFREIEAARLFAERWAPEVIVIPGALREE